MATLAFNSSAFYKKMGNKSEPKPLPSLVHMRMYKGVELLYSNNRALH